MADNIAINDAGDVMLLQEGQWRPAPIAEGPDGARVYHDGQSWVPLPGPRAEGGGLGAHLARGGQQVLGRIGRFADNTVRQLAQGATFGFADELAAGARTGAGLWGDYDAALSEERQRDAQFRADSPIAATAANVVGGIASPVARLLPWLNPGRAASLPGAVARGARAGALGGAAAGFGEGEGGVMPRLGTALVGGGIGATAGAALPLVVAGAAAGAGAVGRRLGLQSGAPEAERIILRDLQRSGVTPEEVLARSDEAAAAGRPAALADIAGDNVRDTAAAIARTPGAGRQAAADLVAERGGAAQGERLAGEVRRAISDQDFRATVDNLLAERSAAAAPLYERAFAQPTGMTERIRAVIDDPIARSGLQRGLEIQRLENTTRLARGEPTVPVEDAAIRFGEDGVPRIVGVPNMRTLDAVKRGLDDIIESARDAMTGRIQWNERLRAIDNLRRTYVGLLDEGNPAYAQARAAWAGPSQALDAMNMGRRLISMGPDAAEVSSREIAAMTPAQREFFRAGVARSLLDRIGAAQDTAEQTRITRLIGTPAVRERLRAAFDDEESFNLFRSALQAEANMAATNHAITPGRNSVTTPMQERLADLRSPPGSGVFIDPEATASRGGLAPSLIRSGLSGGVTGPAFQALDRLQQARTQSRFERNAEALAPMLFGTDPVQRARTAQALIDRALAERRAAQIYAPAAQGATRGLAVGGGLLVDPDSERRGLLD